MLAIKNNMMAQGAARHLGISYDKLATSVERLSSGLRINGAKDDAAGLAVRELIRADVASLRQGSRNANDGVSMLQAAEGALGEIDAIMVRMRELAEQACTDTYSDLQKGIMQKEFDELGAEITRIAETTDFNDINLLNSPSGNVKIGLGGGVSNIDRTIAVAKADLRAESLGLLGFKETALADGASAASVLSATDTYMNNADASNAATLAITFADQAFTLDFTSGETKSLQNIIDDLNSQSLAIDADWKVASSVEDSDGGLILKLTNIDRGDVTDMTIANAASDVCWGDGSTVVATDVSQFSVTDGSDSLDLTAGDDAAIIAVESAIRIKDSYRAQLGYWMNRLEYAASVLDVQAENLSAAESRISDVDVAHETSVLTRNNVLAQAGVAMLSQANSMPEMALRLLQ